MQTIWLRPEATRFAEACEACATGNADPFELVADRAALVAGTLRPAADVRWASCPRGHRVRVRRVGNVY